MKHWFVFFLALASVGSVKGQQTITLSNGNMVAGAYKQPPTRTVKSVDDGYIITYTFDKATVIDDPLYKGSIMWKVAGFGEEDTPQKPALPYRLDSFTVPDGYSVNVKVVDSLFVELPYTLSPARPPLTDSGNVSYTKDNVPTISAYKGFLPNRIANMDNMGVYRGKGVVDVMVSPIQYSYEQNTIRAYKSISYKVTFAKSNTKTYAKVSMQNLVVTDAFLHNTTINGFQQPVTLADTKATNAKKGYLIISTSKFKTSVEKLASWKRLLGFDVRIVLNDSWTSSSVKEEVKKQYNSNSNLYYLLIVGDNADVPGQSSSLMNTHVTDFYYSCMDGDNDLTPDLLFGRLPVATASEANVVVDKIINYEKNPVSDASFYKTGINCAYFQDNDNNSYADRRFAQTSEEVRNALLSEGINVKRIYTTDNSVTPLYWNRGIYSFGESIPDELKKPGFPWKGNASDINSAINNGAFYVLHRDHGNVKFWGDPYYTISNISSLSNGAKLPVVFSMNCLTGKFNEDCFCEAFIKKANGGCVAIYGATQLSYSGYNDALTEGMFDAIWPSSKLHPKFPGTSGTASATPTPTYELGQILNQGQARLAETYGKRNSGYTTYTKELFHCFGDPSMKIYTAAPTAFTNVSVNRGSNAVSVNLNGTTATIAFYDLVSGEVTYTTGTTATYSTNHAANVSVSVSAHNRIPYVNEGTPVTSVYIQNETVVGPKTYTGSSIKVGSSVTTSKASGPVTFKSGTINLNADSITIDSDTTINSETEFKMSNQ